MREKAREARGIGRAGGVGWGRSYCARLRFRQNHLTYVSHRTTCLLSGQAEACGRPNTFTPGLFYGDMCECLVRACVHHSSRPHQPCAVARARTHLHGHGAQDGPEPVAEGDEGKCVDGEEEVDRRKQLPRLGRAGRAEHRHAFVFWVAPLRCYPRLARPSALYGNHSRKGRCSRARACARIHTHAP